MHFRVRRDAVIDATIAQGWINYFLERLSKLIAGFVRRERKYFEP